MQGRDEVLIGSSAGMREKGEALGHFECPVGSHRTRQQCLHR